METPLKLGISACLVGHHVRYDGGHKLDPLLVETLGRFVTFVPVCPETECGLGIPREAMRLTGDPVQPRLVTIHSGVDLTQRLAAWAACRMERLAQEPLRGFILKARSPSCALTDAPILAANGTPIATGPGLFVRALMTALPRLLLSDEAHFHNQASRENFLAQLRRQGS